MALANGRYPFPENPEIGGFGLRDLDRLVALSVAVWREGDALVLPAFFGDLLLTRVAFDGEAAGVGVLEVLGLDEDDFALAGACSGGGGRGTRSGWGCGGSWILRGLGR